MTREEAITVLKAFMKNPLFSEVHKAAFNIAIHDIKAYQDWNINNLILVNKDNYEPTTKNDLGVDLISRADVFQILWNYDYTNPSALIVKAIRELPSMTPQEPKPMVEIDLYSVIKQKYIEREVLDKIRAEISTVYESLNGYDPDSLGAFVSKIDEIFDRYKADREALADIYKPKLKADLCIMDEFAFMPKAESEADNGNDD